MGSRVSWLLPTEEEQEGRCGMATELAEAGLGFFILTMGLGRRGRENVLVKDNGSIQAGGQHSNLPWNTAAPGEVSATLWQVLPERSSQVNLILTT